MKTYSLTSEAVEEKQKDEQNIAQKIWNKDNNTLAILLGITFVSVYYTSAAVNDIIFLVFLFLAYRSKKDYLWLTWFFIINDAPGRLFSAGGLHEMRIPFYSFVSGIGFEFQDLFLFVYIIKAYIHRKDFEFVFKKPFLYFYGTIIVVLIYSFLVGLSFDNLMEAFKFLVPWAWVMVIPLFLPSPKHIADVCRLLFPIVLIALILQIHSFIAGDYLDNILRGRKGEFSLIVTEDEEMEEAARSYSSVYLMIFAVTMALFYQASKRKVFNNNYYLAAIVFAAVISMFLSATRGYILAFGFLTVAAFYQISRSGKIRRIVNLALVSMVLIFVLQGVFHPINRQLNAAMDRLSTLMLLASGDVTAGGTLKRIDVRGKIVLDQAYKSPVIGWGFSNTYFKYGDGHVGPQNIILNVGFAGFLYLHLLFFYLCFKTWNFSRGRPMRTQWGRAPIILLFGLLAIFIIHGSTSQFWGFIMHFDQIDKILTISFMLAAINAFVVASYREDSLEVA